MPNVFDIQASILLVVTLALLAVKIFALVTSLMFTSEHYRAADKVSKPAWVAILGLGVVANLLLPGAPPEPAQPRVHDRRIRLPHRRASHAVGVPSALTAEGTLTRRSDAGRRRPW